MGELSHTVTVFLGIGLFFYALCCWAIIDLAFKDFGGIEKKALWAFIALIPFIGPLIYLLVGTRQGVREKKSEKSI